MDADKINKARLKIFADYLSTQELVARDFFGPTLQLGMQVDDGPVVPVNPVLFMAMFELPHIFPQDWVYNNKFEPVWKKHKKSDPFLSVRAWFGISDHQMEHLFFQGMQQCERFGGRTINEKSTKHDLAYNVIDLINKSESRISEYIIYLN
jgi:hypothetical protein